MKHITCLAGFALLAASSPACLTSAIHVSDSSSGTMDIDGALGPAAHPATAPGWKASDPDLSRVPLPEMVSYNPKGRFRDSSVVIIGNLHFWTLSAPISRTQMGRNTTVIYDKKPARRPISLAGGLHEVFGKVVPREDEPDYRLIVDVSNIQVSPRESAGRLALTNILAIFTGTLYPGRSRNDRMNLQLKLFDRQGSRICERSLAVESWYHFSIWFVLVPWMMDASPWQREDRFQTPYYTPDEMGNIAAYMIESCE